MRIHESKRRSYQTISTQAKLNNFIKLFKEGYSDLSPTFTNATNSSTRHETFPI